MQIRGAKRETRPIMLRTRYFRIASHYRAGFQFDSPFMAGDALTARHRRNIRLMRLKIRHTYAYDGEQVRLQPDLFAIAKSVKKLPNAQTEIQKIDAARRSNERGSEKGRGDSDFCEREGQARISRESTTNAISFFTFERS
jgi:hypothetical protein